MQLTNTVIWLEKDQSNTNMRQAKQKKGTYFGNVQAAFHSMVSRRMCHFRLFRWFPHY